MVANPRLRARFGQLGDHVPPIKDAGASLDSHWPQIPDWKSEVTENKPSQTSCFDLHARDEEYSINQDGSGPGDLLLQLINKNWGDLSWPERERCVQIATRSEVPSPNALIEPTGRLDEIVQKAPSPLHTATAYRGSPSSRTRVNPGEKRKLQAMAQQKTSSRKRKRHAKEDSDSDDEILRAPQLPRVSFRIDEKEKVKAFLLMRFTQIQQSAGKVIAKAWIKAMCPKKQANYPYVDCNPRPDQPRRRPRYPGPPRVPYFWPDLSECRHKEPDHLDKRERTNLLVHLVCIRWDQNAWKQSNGETCEVPRFVRSGDWVQFLQEVYPPEKLVEVPDSTPEKTKRRMDYLRDIYQVAQAEQEFHQRGNDGRMMFNFAGENKPRPRRARNNILSLCGTLQTDIVVECTGSTSNTTTVAPSASPSGRSAHSTKSEEEHSGLDGTFLVSATDETAPESHPYPGRSESASISGPWTMPKHADQATSSIHQSRIPSHQVYKPEAARKLSRIATHGTFFGSIPYYANTQVPLQSPPVWDDSFTPSLEFCPSSQTSFPNQAVQVANGMNGMYREDLGTLDPMLGGLTLRSPPAEVPLYGQDAKMYSEFPNSVVYSMMYMTGLPEAPVDERLTVADNSGTNGFRQQHSQSVYVGQPVGLFSGPQSHEMETTAPGNEGLMIADSSISNQQEAQRGFVRQPGRVLGGADPHGMVSAVQTARSEQEHKMSLMQGYGHY